MNATNPDFRSWQPRFAAIRTILDETPGVRTYDLAFDESMTNTPFRPGQFNMLYLPGIGESAISMSSDPDDRQVVRHTVREVGNVTRAMARLQPGDQIGVRGPYGTAWPVEDFHGKDVILVAGGIGLAPLRPVIYHIIRRRVEYARVSLIIGSRTPADLLYSTEYEVWRAAGINVLVTVNVGSPDWQGSIGFVTTPLAGLPLDPARTGVFACGPEIMMRVVANAAVGRGLQPSQVFVSLERNMNCAIGLCGHCQFGPAFVCKDGPVFPYDRVQRLLLVETF
jgi:NAD(P)H-flavin reductase